MTDSTVVRTRDQRGLRLLVSLLVALASGCAGPLATLGDDAVEPRAAVERVAQYRNALAQLESGDIGRTDEPTLKLQLERLRQWIDRLEAEPPESDLAPVLDKAIAGQLQVFHTRAQVERLDGSR